MWVFTFWFLAAAALLLILIFVGSFLCSAVQKNSESRKAWIVYYIVLGLSAFGLFSAGLNDGLSLYVTIPRTSAKPALTISLFNI